MQLTREFLDPGLVYVAATGLCAALFNAWSVRRPFATPPAWPGEGLQMIGAGLIPALLSLAVTGNVEGTMFAAALVIAVASAVKIALPALTMSGATMMAATPLALIIGAPWTYLLLSEAGAPGWAVALAVLGSLVSIAMLGLSFAGRLVRTAMFTHREWSRPHQPLPRLAPGRAPKVSIHVPCYAEPPEMVIEVLDHLARLDYPNFEVLVCDNNTKDEALWRPLQAHCARLSRAGKDFRFFHVAPLPGAKAGALNYLLDRMGRDVELVAVIDADYISEPDFLSRLVGFFNDPQVGYVQTPHDYREASSSDYMRACYWEYMPTNRVELPGINEYGAAFTIGTMCVLRADALNAAGRWAEWCLTEDSEVSVRLRAIGYRGIYLPQTFGRGLIPETFDDYKKQRYRWTAGPVQQLLHHWRLYLPRAISAPSSMPNWSRLLEVQRGFAPLAELAGTVLAAVAAVGGTLLVHLGVLPPVDAPDAAWVALGLGSATALVLRWHRYRLSGCHSLADMARGELARLSLTYVQMVAAAAALSPKPLAWRRTPKFKAEGSGLRALQTTLPETCVGVVHLALAVVPLQLSDRLGTDITLLLVLLAVVSSFRFFAAPVMALLSERRLSATAGHNMEEAGFGGRTAEA